MKMRVFLFALCLFIVACDRNSSGGSGWLPPPDFKPDISLGQQLFAKNCQGCHGENARGTNQGPPLVHKVYEPSHHADVAFYMAVRNGVRAHHWQFGDMPAISNVSAEQAGHIVAFVRQRQRLAGIR